MIDIGEGMGYGECCELCKADDSQTCAPEANNTVYVNLKKKEKNSANMIIVLIGQIVFLVEGDDISSCHNYMYIHWKHSLQCAL